MLYEVITRKPHLLERQAIGPDRGTVGAQGFYVSGPHHSRPEGHLDRAEKVGEPVIERHLFLHLDHFKEIAVREREDSYNFV